MKLERNDSGFPVRVPDHLVVAPGLVEGDGFDPCAIGDGQVAVVTERQRRLVALARLSKPTVAFPGDCRFDREEAKTR